MLLNCDQEFFTCNWMWHITFLSTALKMDEKHECMGWCQDGTIINAIHKPLGLLAEIWQKGVKVLNTLSTDIYFYKVKVVWFDVLSTRSHFQAHKFLLSMSLKRHPLSCNNPAAQVPQTSFTFGRAQSPSNPYTDNLCKACFIRLLMETIHCFKTFSFAFI